MNYEKTGRLIRRKRQALGLTQLQLSKELAVTPQAVSLWEKGKRFPDASAQVMLFRVLGLNPVELLVGLEMFDKELKQDIAAYMNRIDEQVRVAGMWKDEDGNDMYIDFSGFELALMDRNGDLTGETVPFTAYYNVLPAPEYKDPYALPESPYDPGMIYLNNRSFIFTIPVEVLKTMGNPLYFHIVINEPKTLVGLRFTDEMTDYGYAIPEIVYHGGLKGICVRNDGFGRTLCKKMGVRRTLDLISVEPVYDMKQRAILLQLDKAKRVNTTICGQHCLLP